MPTIRTAIAQSTPVLLNRDATLDVVVHDIHAAARDGAQLVAFSEAFVPGYPIWIERLDGATFNSSIQKELHALYAQNAVCIEEGHLQPVQDAARQHSIAVVLGTIERAGDRGGHSLYCSCIYIDPDGQIGSVQRKLMPTYEERLTWSIGDGAGLVTHGLHGFTLGALNCWENWMPLARTALYAQGENLHVAIWPGCEHNTRDITRFIARESRSYVISASSMLRGADVPAGLPSRDRIAPDPDEVILNGGSCIAGPDGEFIVEPQTGSTGLIFADLDLQRVYEERQNFDAVGHYCRPDVLQLHVNRKRQSSATFHDD